MRDIDLNFFEALDAAPEKGIVPRKLVLFKGKSFSTGSDTELAVWTGDEEREFTVENGETNTSTTRTYSGGVNLSVSSIPQVSDLTVQTVSVTLSHIAPLVETFIRGSDLRLGTIEIHDMLLNTTSRKPVSVAPLICYGEIDGSPIYDPEVGGEGSVTIRCIPKLISMLTRTNPAKSSYQEQKLRDGDEFGLHGATVATWNIPWGTQG